MLSRPVMGEKGDGSFAPSVGRKNRPTEGAKEREREEDLNVMIPSLSLK